MPSRSAASALVAGSLVMSLAAAGEAPPCLVERADGTRSSGSVRRLTPAGLDLAGVDGTIPLDEIRSLDFGRGDASPAENRGTFVESSKARVVLVDGSAIGADDVAFSAEGAKVVRAGGQVSLGRTAIATVEFAPATPPAPWLAKVRGAGEGAAEADVVIVGSQESPEFVECAIVAVDPDFVTVLLDEETIRVKRSKVIGLAWLREKPAGAASPAAVVDVVGGRLQGRSVSIDGEWLSIETVGAGTVRLPATDLLHVDFGAVRTLSLVSLAPEKTEVEPWFGLFKSLEGLSAHFEPRAVRTAGDAGRSREALLIRPRTLISWRIPEDGRSVRMRIAETATEVIVSLDDREVYRGSPTTEVAIDSPVERARRLKVTVDFPAGGPGTGGPNGSEARLIEPRIER